MGFNRLDKINTLVALEHNKGNKSQTAKEMGVSRQTLINWCEQLEQDIKLQAQVKAAIDNMAYIEEVNALKASAEISRRLDTPTEISDKDLRAYKDSSFTNARLIRGLATSIVQQTRPPIEIALEYADKYLRYLETQGIAGDDAMALLGEKLADNEVLERVGVNRSVREEAILRLSEKRA